MNREAGEMIEALISGGRIEDVDKSIVTQASQVVSDQMLASIAISLKRIADALDTGRARPELYGLVVDIAFQAGTAFENGRRQV